MPRPQFDPSARYSVEGNQDSQRGAGLAEYGLLLLLIALACLLAMATMGTTLADLYDTITTTLFP